MDAEPGLRLVEPTEDDGPTLLAAVAASRTLHHPWVRPPDDIESYVAWLARSRRDDHASYLVWRASDLVGVVALNQIVRGPRHSAQLGFYGFVPHTGHGWMRQALTRLCDLAMGEHGLDQLEAHVQPANDRSLRLLASLGFVHRGPSPHTLHLGGRLRVHEQWLLTARDWLAPPRRGSGGQPPVDRIGPGARQQLVGPGEGAGAEEAP